MDANTQKQEVAEGILNSLSHLEDDQLKQVIDKASALLNSKKTKPERIDALRSEIAERSAELDALERSNYLG